VGFARNIGHLYRTLLIAVFKTISIAMILVGLLIALCIVADKIFQLGWGYPWWSLFFCIVYIGISATIYRAIPSFVAHVDRQRGGSAGSKGNDK
jgi:hypothetical protein